MAVQPHLLANAPHRGIWVDFISSGNVAASTGFKLGKSALAAVPSGAYTIKAATRDENGLWSELSSAVSLTPSNFSAGTSEGSVGSGALSDYEIQNPGFEWPDLSMGSGKSVIRKTLISKSGAFIDEVRASRWNRSQTVFHCILSDLDQWQSETLQRFFRAVNGPHRPFLFDWFDPAGGPMDTGSPQRFLVRFRDSSLVGKTTDVELTSYDIYLIQVIEDCEGGDN